MTRKLVVTTFVKNLLGGGAERVAVNLLKGLPQDLFTQELVMVSAWGPFLEQVPAHVKQIDLAQGGKGDEKGQGDVGKAIIPLIRYLRERKPDILISHLAHANVAAVVAVACARTGTKVILLEHNDTSWLEASRARTRASKLMRHFKHLAYGRADRVVTVSQGIARHVEKNFKVPAEKISTIYNPVVGPDLVAQAQRPVAHPWFAPGAPPVLIAGGRLSEEKDFPTLLRAFALVRAQRPCRLLILGEGAQRPALEAEIQALGLGDAVSLPGFVENPYAYLRAASLFVLSSRREGLPTVLIEAMACGTPVVATDCPSGPAEILEDGRLGRLIEVANPEVLAQGILAELANPTPAALLAARAERFSFDTAISSYTELFTQIVQGVPPAASKAQSPTTPQSLPGARVRVPVSRTLQPTPRTPRRAGRGLRDRNS